MNIVLDLVFLEFYLLLPPTGSYGGGQTLTLAGVGFDSSNTTVTVCNLPCAVTGITTATQVTCTTPAKAVGESANCLT